MGGGRIIPRSLKTTENENCIKLFSTKAKKFFFVIDKPFIFAKNSFSKIKSMNCGRDVLILGQNVKIYSLV